MMKKIFAITALALLLVGEAGAQSMYTKELKFNYQNGNTHSSVNTSGVALGDTLAGTTADTVFIGVLDGNRYPDFVNACIQLTNTTGDADTVLASWERGLGGLYRTAVNALIDTLAESISTTMTTCRTFDTATTLDDTQAEAITTYKAGCNSIRLRLVATNVPATARIKFVIKAFGVYKRQ